MNNFRKIDLQLFADDGSSDNVSTEQTAQENTEVEVKSYSEEELTSIKEQWEKDKESEYATRLKDEISKALEEEKRVAKLSKDEKDAEEKKKLLEQIQTLENERALSKLKETTLNALNEQKLPHSFLNIVLGADEKSTMDNITSLKTEFDKAVQEVVEERLKGKTPSVSTGNTNRSLDEQFANALNGRI